MSIELHCPHCTRRFALREANDSAEWAQLVDTLTALPPVLHHPLWNYLGLFKPLKQRLRISRMALVLDELLPVIRQQAIQRGHRAKVPVPHDSLARVLDWLYSQPPATLKLPLRSNGYLFEVLAAKGAALAAEREQEAIETQKRRPRTPEQDSGNRDGGVDPWKTLKQYGITPPDEKPQSNPNQPPNQENDNGERQTD